MPITIAQLANALGDGPLCYQGKTERGTEVELTLLPPENKADLQEFGDFVEIAHTPWYTPERCAFMESYWANTKYDGFWGEIVHTWSHPDPDEWKIGCTVGGMNELESMQLSFGDTCDTMEVTVTNDYKNHTCSCRECRNKPIKYESGTFTLTLQKSQKPETSNRAETVADFFA